MAHVNSSLSSDQSADLVGKLVERNDVAASKSLRGFYGDNG